MRCVLPTDVLVRRYAKQEKMFIFLPGGVKEVIEQLVGCNEGYLHGYYEEPQKTDASIKVIEECLSKFEGSYLRNTLLFQDPQYPELIEITLECILFDINQMMKEIGFNEPYETTIEKWIDSESLLVEVEPV